MSATVLRSCFGLDMRIDILEKSFFTHRAHYEDVVLVYLTVQVFLALLCRHVQQLSKFVARALMPEFLNGTVKHGPHSDGYLVLGGSVRKNFAT